MHRFFSLITKFVVSKTILNDYANYLQVWQDWTIETKNNKGCKNCGT